MDARINGEPASLRAVEEVRNHPEEVVRRVEQDYHRRMRLSELFGEDYASQRQQVLTNGFFEFRGSNKRVFVQTKTIDGVDPSEDREVVAIAAVARDPGLTQDYIDTLADFRVQTGGDSQRARKIQQYWRIYETEGLVNNAINKYASLLSVGGRFKVRNAKKGKQQKAKETADAILDHFNRHVNSPSETGVATASRGLKSLTEQGIRMALVEGDFMGRQVWGDHDVGTLGKFSMPMTIQTLSMEFMEPLKELNGLGEYWYWNPSDDLKKLIKGETKLPKQVKDIVKKLFDNDIAKQIKGPDGKALLDPALLVHVKHRGSDRSLFGESFIEPAKLGIRYLRAVSNTDMVSMENVINRLLVVMVGSSDPASPYSKADVAASRAALMQSFFEDTGPAMTIVWQGDDVKVESVGAMDNMLDLSERHKIGERKIIVSLGIPAALLDGSASEGKAAGWASLIAASGMAEHLGSAFARAWTEVGIRILLENGFQDIDIEYEYDRSNLGDKVEERNQNRLDYVAGGMSLRDWIAGMGKDPDAWYNQRCFERGLTPGQATWEEVAQPPQGLPGQGEGGIQGTGPGKAPGGGRSPNGETGRPTPTAPKEKTTPTEAK